jgi:hypothetical protein
MRRRTLLALLAVFMLGPVTAVAQDAPFVRDVYSRINGQRKQHGLCGSRGPRPIEVLLGRLWACYRTSADGVGRWPRVAL